jgi:hypothetical protein
MQLSIQALQDLRAELKRVYGTDFGLEDGDLDEIGMFLLTALAESLKFQYSRGKIKELH